MNGYGFEVEVDDGWFMYYTFAACKLSAYENLIEYLKEQGYNPENAKVHNIYVDINEEEEE